MRKVLCALDKARWPDHRGLAHDVWSPLVTDARKASSRSKQEQERAQKRVDAWVEHLCARHQPAHYPVALARWQRSLRGHRDRMIVAHTSARLLVGHGNPAPTEVGLTLHRTWGVPVIPGSALAGLLAHYAEIVLGPHDDLSEEERARRQPWAGPTRDDDGNPTAPPGCAYQRVFGAPPIRDRPRSARRGGLIVHDALWLPDGALASEDDAKLERSSINDAAPFERDVLTVHHRGYYEGRAEPDDHDDPNPVSFLTVRPGVRFLFALSCDDPEILTWATEALERALTDWGAGGKTGAGYGRFERFKVLPSPALDELRGELEARKQRGDSVQARLDWLASDEQVARLRETLSAGDRGPAAELLRSHFNLGKKKKQKLKLQQRQQQLEATIARISGA